VITRDLVARAAGAELRRMRIAAGMTQAQVAVFTDSHRPIIGRIERGYHAPLLETCQLVAAVTGGDVRRVLRAVDRARGLRAQRPRVSARAARMNAEPAP
jgi:DNA-binding XRE family transcriptional regulator